MSNINMNINTIMVFGVFDTLHLGHIYFLNKAKSYCNNLLIVVTRDEVVEKLKNHRPIENERTRWGNLQHFYYDPVLLGDVELGKYDVINKYKPDLICLGYDQDGLYNNLIDAMNKDLIHRIGIKFIDAYQPEIYHSSLLNKVSTINITNKLDKDIKMKS